jgi:hypothetical protein
MAAAGTEINPVTIRAKKAITICFFIFFSPFETFGK